MRKFLSGFSAVGWITLALIVATEAWFLAASEPLTGIPFLEPTSDDATVVAKRRLMKRSDGAIVLIGDSSCMFGLEPGIIRDAVRVPCVNLGTLLSFTLGGYESLIQEVLERQKPAAVVLVLNPRAFRPEAIDAARFGMLGRYLFAYHRDNHGYAARFKEFQSWFFRKHQFNTFPREFGGSFRAFQARLDSSGGFFPEFHHYPGALPREQEAVFDPSEFTRAALARLRETARAKGVPVFFRWSPVPRDAVDSAFVAAVNAFGGELASRYGFGMLGDSLPAWRPELFATVTHLNAEGAEMNSRDLAARLAQRLQSD